LSPSLKLRAAGVVAALLLLAVLTGRASPGFPLAKVGGAVGRTIQHALRVARVAPPPAASARVGSKVASDASQYALGDIPVGYLGLYVRAAAACPQLSWQVLAGIGKVETNHGRSSAPGVRAGVNSFGCCSGPMQFNIRNGPPSTWDTYGDGTLAHVYDPRYAIPAAARLLCANGLGSPRPPPADPCPTVAGTPAQHAAIKRYNNACWYVHQVLTLAAAYTRASATTPQLAPSHDPFVVALAHNPRLGTTRSAGCDPAPDLASGRLDLRVTSLLAVLAERYRLRISCAHSGHSKFVKGTTRVSNHTVWRAVDIDRVNGQPVSAASAAARGLVGWLDGLQGPLRPAEVGSPFGLGHRPYFTDDGHQDHIHIGYGPM
jgi:hypothetical protein